ncbi:diguanylate cyclase [Aquitalea sp.]|nr:diguanylate cyclase [Aquitalea sp.]
MVLKQRDFRHIVEHANDAIVVTEVLPHTEPGPRIVYVNHAFCRLCGYDRAEILGRSPRFLQGPQTDRSVLQTIRIAMEEARPIRLQLLNYHKSGRAYWVELSIMPLLDDAGSASHFVAIERDVTQWHSLHEALYLLAVTDELTGLFNRRMFVDVGNKFLNLARRHGTSLCVVMLDLDHFKLVNDCYGHQTGDQLLQLVGKVLEKGIRDSDVAGRLGGEEFGILLPDTAQQDALLVVRRIQTLLHSECRQTNLPAGAWVTVSIGLSMLGTADSRLDSILQRADQALYTAKERGRNRIEISS